VHHEHVVIDLSPRATPLVEVLRSVSEGASKPPHASAVRRAETTASSTAAASRSRTSGAASVSSGLLVMRDLEVTADSSCGLSPRIGLSTRGNCRFRTLRGCGGFEALAWRLAHLNQRLGAVVSRLLR
jgi:hypothetical protein